MKPAVLAVVFMVVFGHQVSSYNLHKELGEAVREFGRKLQQKLTHNKANSIVLSPFSSHSSLSMTSLGARTETAEEMERTLNYVSPPLSPSDALVAYSEIFSELQSVHNVEVANGLFINVEKAQSIKQSFKSEAESKYLAKIDSFNASESDPERKINQYVSEKTDGKIQDILAPGSINDLTVMLVVNTLSYNASWAKQFEESKTRKRDFTREDGSKIEVDMMKDNRTVHRKIDNESNAYVIRLPYKFGRHALFIALPQSAGGLADLELHLSQPGKTSELLKGLKPAKVEVNLPKFKIANGFDLKESLKEMGMELAFSKYQADFSGISDLPGKLYINKVNHNAEIEVYEQGTSAAAATVVEFSVNSSGGEEADEVFSADHAFLYWLMDTSNELTLFQGRFMGRAY